MQKKCAVAAENKFDLSLNMQSPKIKEDVMANFKPNNAFFCAAPNAAEKMLKIRFFLSILNFVQFIYRIEHPCENCEAAYTFKNHVSLRADTARYSVSCKIYPH